MWIILCLLAVECYLNFFSWMLVDKIRNNTLKCNRTRANVFSLGRIRPKFDRTNSSSKTHPAISKNMFIAFIIALLFSRLEGAEGLHHKSFGFIRIRNCPVVENLTKPLVVINSYEITVLLAWQCTLMKIQFYTAWGKHNVFRCKSCFHFFAQFRFRNSCNVQEIGKNLLFTTGKQVEVINMLACLSVKCCTRDSISDSLFVLTSTTSPEIVFSALQAESNPMQSNRQMNQHFFMIIPHFRSPVIVMTTILVLA